jgi:RNA polymerase sigma-70 factor (ECF subfamily)
MRRRRGRTALSLDAIEDSGDAGLRATGPGPLELALSRDLRRAVARAMEELTPEEREVIVLKEYQGLTFPEIAETLGVPLSTVKTRLYRGLGQLRHRLERQGIRGVAAVGAATP